MQASHAINMGAILLFTLLTVYFLYDTYTEMQRTELAVLSTIHQPASIAVKTSNHQRPNITNLHNLFGAVLQKNELPTSAKNIKPMQHGPVTLEGVFIQNKNNTLQAWALATDRGGEPLIIYPEQIISFTAASISIKTKQGLKSLHIKKNEQGIDIRKVRKKQVAGLDKKNGTKKPELSRAEKLRKKMLGK